MFYGHKVPTWALIVGLAVCLAAWVAVMFGWALR